MLGSRRVPISQSSSSKAYNLQKSSKRGETRGPKFHKVRPAIFRQKRFRYTSPKFHPLHHVFTFRLLSLSLFFSLLRIPRSSLCPPPPPPFSFVLLVSLSSRDKMGQNTKRTKPQIYNFAMRIIIEYQKLCYSLFHSAHLLPQRAVFPRRGNKSSR